MKQLKKYCQLVKSMQTKKVNIILILLLAFFLRVYRIQDLLGFWYDQGRDALVIWDLIHNGKFFLIGPMMGFTGMFRGPWYYYLITPFYYLSAGNPLGPTIFLVLMSIAAIYVLYLVGKKIGGERAGILSAFLATISTYIIGSSRWLSNPTPMIFIGIVLIWAVFKFLEKKWWSLPLIALLVGMGLNFGAATELYYIPALLFIFYLNRKNLPNIKIFVISVFVFVMCFAPQVMFEFRHRGVLSGALYNFIFQEKTFTLNFLEIFRTRLVVYYNLFSSKFWTDGGLFFLPFFAFFVYSLISKWKTFWKDKKFQVVFIFAISPIIGTLFFVSNLGGFYDYYFTGYYLVFILLFSYVISNSWNTKFGKVVLLAFLLVSIYKNSINYNFNYNKSLSDKNIIAFKNQISAIDWIKSDAKDDKFNVDVYVPPVVPYAYEYLFKWKKLPIEEKQTKLLYTLYEVDPDHPERLEAWMNRQKGIGRVIVNEMFGGIVVERRERI